MWWLRSQIRRLVTLAWRGIGQAWAWCGPHRESVVLLPSGIFVALAGPLASWFHTGIDYWFVFAAGLTNAVAFWELKPQVFGKSETRPWWVGLSFFIELLFLVAMLAVGICVALGKASEMPAQILTPFCLIVLIAYLALRRDRKNLDVVIWGLLLVLLLWFLPTFRHWWSSFDSGRKDDDLWQNVIRARLYPGIHLVLIPLVYYLVDRIVVKSVPKVRDFLFLDKVLLGTGFACAFSGFFFAWLNMPESAAPYPEHGSGALYEAGAAAVILLLGNSWYLSIRRQQEQHEHHGAAVPGSQIGNGQNPKVDGAGLDQS